jgi:hypothetical protein
MTDQLPGSDQPKPTRTEAEPQTERNISLHSSDGQELMRPTRAERPEPEKPAPATPGGEGMHQRPGVVEQSTAADLSPRSTAAPADHQQSGNQWIIDALAGTHSPLRPDLGLVDAAVDTAKQAVSDVLDGTAAQAVSDVLFDATQAYQQGADWWRENDAAASEYEGYNTLKAIFEHSLEPNEYRPQLLREGERLVDALDAVGGTFSDDPAERDAATDWLTCESAQMYAGFFPVGPEFAARFAEGVWNGEDAGKAAANAWAESKEYLPGAEGVEDISKGMDKLDQGDQEGGRMLIARGVQEIGADLVTIAATVEGVSSLGAGRAAGVGAGAAAGERAAAAVGERAAAAAAEGAGARAAGGGRRGGWRRRDGRPQGTGQRRGATVRTPNCPGNRRRESPKCPGREAAIASSAGQPPEVHCR